MAVISLCIVPSRQNKDGTHTIRISIAANGKTTYINTPFKVNSTSEWKNGKVVKNPSAAWMNLQLANLLNSYLEKYYNDLRQAPLSATEVKEYMKFRANQDSSVFSVYALRYIAQCVENGQKTYARNLEYTLKYFTECFGENLLLSQINLTVIKAWEKYLFKRGDSSTTVNIRMSHLKAIINAASNDGTVKYDIPPFAAYKMPSKAVRDIALTKAELKALRELDFQQFDQPRRYVVARDLFMLSFYCAGINLTDIVDARLDGDSLLFIRKKTADKKQGEKRVAITIQPEARSIIANYIGKDGKLDFGYNFSNYEYFRSSVTHSLNRIGKALNFEKQLTFYAARKTFCQFGFELGVPLFVLEYAIGQTIKDAAHRPIFNYIRVMRSHADVAIRTIIDYSLSDGDDMQKQSGASFFVRPTVE
jgi:integrase